MGGTLEKWVVIITTQLIRRQKPIRFQMVLADFDQDNGTARKYTSEQKK